MMYFQHRNKTDIFGTGASINFYLNRTTDTEYK